MQPTREKLIDFLVKNVVTKEQLDKAIEIQRTKGGSIGKILVDLGYVSEEKIMSALSKYLNLAPIDLQKVNIDPQVMELIPRSIATFYEVVPISKVGDILTVAMADPLNILAIDDLKMVTGYKIEPVISNHRDVKRAIDMYYTSTPDLEDVVKDIPISEVELPTEAEAEIDVDKLIKETGVAPVIRIVNLILYNAITSRASDIHIEPYEHEVRLRYRIDGVLYESSPPPKHMHQAIVSRIKIISKLDIAERRVPQDGRFRIRFEGKEVDFRVSTLPTSFGEKIVLRVLDKSALCVDLDKLGLEGYSLDTFYSCIKMPYGMILITGPTGSGKTTTLYSALSVLNTPNVNIITVEDPIEYQFHGINQVAVRPEVGLTFASGLRSILRQDPDIIMVGEIRDLETADIAIKAALTGHLVLSTLHTNDAPSAITRLVDMGIEPFLISSSVLMVVAQRLVRKICPNCKTKVKIKREVLERVGIEVKSEEDQWYYRGEGCNNCKILGYTGRIAIFEVLKVTPEIKDLIEHGASTMEIKQLAVKQGMQTLRMAGLVKAKEGITSFEEVLRVTARD